MEKKSVQEFLIAEFDSRIKKNSSYSLRAYARDLNLVPSHLFSVLNYKAGLSTEKALTISKSLKLRHAEKKYFIELVNSQFSRNKTQRNISLSKLKKLENQYKKQFELDADLFNLLSDWYHFAILELTYLTHFQSDPNWISHALNISVIDAEMALVRLLKYKLLKLSNGRLMATEDYSAVPNNNSSISIRKFHTQILKKAILSIESQTTNERSLRSSMIAIRKNKLNEAFAAIEKFHEEFCVAISEDSNFNFEKDSVYALSTQFFKLTDCNKGNA